MSPKKVKTFIYKSFNIDSTNGAFHISYEYEIPGQVTFKHYIDIPKKEFKFRPTNSNLIQCLVFNIGMIVMFDYWILDSTHNINIECCSLDDNQINWWKEYCLSAFNKEIELSCDKDKHIPIEKIIYDDNDFSGYVVSIDNQSACVTLETLNLDRESDFCLIINPTSTSKVLASISGFNDNNIIEVTQIYDEKLIKKNNHNESQLIAFVGYFLSFLLSKKYVAVSNQSYSKTFGRSLDFENRFRTYADKYLPTPIEYFSYLRPLNNLQVLCTFAKLQKYHPLYNSHKNLNLKLDSQVKPKIAASKFKSSYYIKENNLIPEQEFQLKKFFL